MLVARAGALRSPALPRVAPPSPPPWPSQNAIRLFVATVPVIVDVAFKYWVYKYLRKLAPGTHIILGEIERH